MIEKIIDGGVTTPMGFMAAGVNADIKGKGLDRCDTAILVSDVPCISSGLFTTNLVQAAPVKYDKEILYNTDNKIKAIIVNSGNANACTGKDGLTACSEVAKKLSQKLYTNYNSVLVASTGVIGVPLPYEKIINKIGELCENLSDDNGSEFAKAIMTTDTVSKEEACIVTTDNGIFSIGGCTKGAGMISPALATMLTFITTDVSISRELLDKALKECADVSFNRISVDGDMSTNDSIFIMANGMSGITINESNYELFKEALMGIMVSLAKKIARDGEGATKLVTIHIKNAKNDNEAHLCAAKIGNSPLVKTMFAGCDPNWGRLMSSAGASGADFDPDMTDIFFNDLHYVKNGIIIDYSLEEKVYNIMKESEYTITIDLHSGSSSTTFYTCDMTTDYVKINADYRS